MLDLTPTELDILRMIVGGMSDSEIAFALDLTHDHIQASVDRICVKIHVADRASASALAIQQGLVKIEL